MRDSCQASAMIPSIWALVIPPTNYSYRCGLLLPITLHPTIDALSNFYLEFDQRRPIKVRNQIINELDYGLTSFLSSLVRASLIGHSKHDLAMWFA